MSDLPTKWIVVGVLIIAFAVAELILGRLFGIACRPVDFLCRRLPRRVQIALVALLLSAAGGAWLYGCTRPGLR